MGDLNRSGRILSHCLSSVLSFFGAWFVCLSVFVCM